MRGTGRTCGCQRSAVKGSRASARPSPPAPTACPPSLSRHGLRAATTLTASELLRPPRHLTTLFRLQRKKEVRGPVLPRASALMLLQRARSGRPKVRASGSHLAFPPRGLCHRPREAGEVVPPHSPPCHPPPPFGSLVEGAREVPPLASH
jgi:hypothetical protein